MREQGAALPLEGLVVLERSISIAGGFAGRQLRDAGARVIVVQALAPEWFAHAPTPELADYLHAGKEIVTEADDASAARLARGADIVIWESADVPRDELLSAMAKERVVVAITPWGRTGGAAGRPWTDLTIQAASGSLHNRGEGEREPLMSGSCEPLWLAGAAAAVAALVGLCRGAGNVVDVTLLVAAHTAFNCFIDVAAALSGVAHQPANLRRRLLPSIEPTKDGWVGFTLGSRRNLEDFCVLIDRPDFLADEEMRSSAGRYRRESEWNDAVVAWTSIRTTDEIVQEASLMGIPAAPVHTAASLLDDPHVRHREYFEPIDDAESTALHPAPPFLIDGERPIGSRGRPSSRSIDAVHLQPRPARFDPSLGGVRVVDFGQWWAGALASGVLAAAGADVIKIESAERFDGARAIRGSMRATLEEQWWETGQYFLSLNNNKRGITLDLSADEGRDTARALIERGDVLIENFAPGTMEQLGFGDATVRTLNPDIVHVRMPAYGLDGPRRNERGYAQTVEQFSGLCARTGYSDGRPVNPNGVTDPMGGLNAAFATLAVLHGTRVADRRGGHVEAPLVEAAMTIAVEQVISLTVHDRLLTRAGNSYPGAAFQGVLRASGTEQWVAVSVVSARNEAYVRQVTGQPRGSLARALESWAIQHSAVHVAEVLQAGGVPAAEVADCRFVHEDTVMAATGYYEQVAHPVAGVLSLPTLPYRFSGERKVVRSAAPLLGEHTADVLSEIARSRERRV